MLHLAGCWPGAKSLLNVKSCVSSTGPDHNKNRETANLDHCHQTGPVSAGQKLFVRLPNVAHNLPVGSRLTLFGNLRSLGGYTLGSTNVCLLPYTYTGTIQEIPEISHPRSGIPVQGPAIRFAHSTHGVHCDTK